MKINEILIVNNLVNPSKMGGGKLLSSSLGDSRLLRVKNKINNSINASNDIIDTSMRGE